MSYFVAFLLLRAKQFYDKLFYLAYFFYQKILGLRTWYLGAQTPKTFPFKASSSSYPGCFVMFMELFESILFCNFGCNL